MRGRRRGRGGRLSRHAVESCTDDSCTKNAIQKIPSSYMYIYWQIWTQPSVDNNTWIVASRNKVIPSTSGSDQHSNASPRAYSIGTPLIRFKHENKLQCPLEHLISNKKLDITLSAIAPIFCCYSRSAHGVHLSMPHLTTLFTALTHGIIIKQEVLVRINRLLSFDGTWTAYKGKGDKGMHRHTARLSDKPPPIF